MVKLWLYNHYNHNNHNHNNHNHYNHSVTIMVISNSGLESPTEPGAASSVAILNASSGLTDQPSISSCSKDKETSGS